MEVRCRRLHPRLFLRAAGGPHDLGRFRLPSITYTSPLMGPEDFADIDPPEATTSAPSTRTEYGLPIPPTQRLSGMSAAGWEQVVLEWAFSLKKVYKRVRRYGGTGDLGIDVVGFVHDAQDLRHDWDNYQCKHYDHPITMADVRLEFGKIIYYSYIREYIPPRRYYFVAPLGVSTSLSKQLRKPESLRTDVLDGWDKHCSGKITKTKSIPLDSDLRAYIEKFDFTIFDDVTPIEIIDGLRQTPYFATRFGGGLPDRPKPAAPPPVIQSHELRYVRQLYEAYGDHLKRGVDKVADVDDVPHVAQHFQRSRESFFSAEALRNFARDTVPLGTFDDLLDDLYAGVADTCDGVHADGFERVRATTDRSASLQLDGNALSTHVKIRDRHGMCHQLANEDRLVWVKKK